MKAKTTTVEALALHGRDALEAALEHLRVLEAAAKAEASQNVPLSLQIDIVNTLFRQYEAMGNHNASVTADRLAAVIGTLRRLEKPERTR